MPPENPASPPSSPQPSLAGHHLRLFALLIDYLMVVIVLNLMNQLLLGEHWDLRPLEDRGGGWTYWIVTGAALFLTKDVWFQRSPGKWFTGIAIGQAENPLLPPSRTMLALRNVPLLLLPVEAVLVFVDPYSRRLGDRWMGTVVIEPLRPAHMGRRMLVFTSLLMGVLLLAFLVAPWNMRRTSAYQEAVLQVMADPQVHRRVGDGIEVTESGGFDLRLEEGAERAELNFAAIGTRGQAEGTVSLVLLVPERRWVLESFELEETPALEIRDAEPDNDVR